LTLCVTPCPSWLKNKRIKLQIINQLDKSIKIFVSPYELAENFAKELIRMINKSAKKKKPLSVALSGGSTPELLFSLLGDHFSKSGLWKYVHFFWGDERCVGVDNPESNYGMTMKKFLGKIEIPFANIHRIIGEQDPEKEAVRYSDEILSCTSNRDGLPVFDIMMLGLGDDGHTASIFPGNMNLIDSDKICEVSLHPVTHQKRITVTGRVINNSDCVIFLVSGMNKAGIVEKIIKKRASATNYPAYYIVPLHGKLRWFIDKEAGQLL
jgi:6-phosphogluconolactonase